MDKFVETKFSEICEFENGDRGKNYPSRSAYINEGIPFFSAGNISDNRIVESSLNFISKERFDRLSNGKVRKGDVLFCLRGSLGKFAIIENHIEGGIASSLVIIRPSNKIALGFLRLFLESDLCSEMINNYDNGTAQPNLSAANLKKFKIPLPPLPEQERIVAKLDGLFEKIDQAIRFLEENIAHTVALMGSVLDEEFGKLDSKSFVLKDISEKIQYGYTGKTKGKGKYYYLRITDIQDGQVDFDKTPFSDIPNDKVSKYLLNKGDILFARTGATAGKSYLFNDEEQSIFASYLIRVVVNQDTLSSSYLKWYFQSDDYWSQIFGNIVGAAQPNFNGKKLGELIIPVPSLEIQKRCVSKFEKYDEVIRGSIKTQTQKLNHLKALKSSLLDQAFKGEL